MPALTHKEKRHVAAHTQITPSGKVILVAGYEADRAIATIPNPSSEEVDTQFQKIFGERIETPAPDQEEIGQAFTAIFGHLPEIAPTEHKAVPKDIARVKEALGLDGFRFDESAREVWNRYCKVDPAESLKQIFGTFGRGGTLVVTGTGSGMEWTYRNGRVAITRTFNLASGVVEHSYFQAGETGDDKGKALFRGSMDFYQKIGLKKITVHANIDVGSYAWARYRFIPNDTTSLNIIKRAVRGHAKYAIWAQNPDFKRAMETDDLRNAWTIADFISKEVKDGRLQRSQNPMLNLHWYGHIDLKNASQVEACRKYITPRERAA